MFYKIDVLKIFAKFKEKLLRQSLFFYKVANQACNFIKKETPAQLFLCVFCEIFKNIFFLQNISKQLTVF